MQVIIASCTLDSFKTFLRLLSPTSHIRTEADGKRRSRFDSMTATSNRGRQVFHAPAMIVRPLHEVRRKVGDLTMGGKYDTLSVRKLQEKLHTLKVALKKNVL